LKFRDALHQKSLAFPDESRYYNYNWNGFFFQIHASKLPLFIRVEVDIRNGNFDHIQCIVLKNQKQTCLSAEDQNEF